MISHEVQDGGRKKCPVPYLLAVGIWASAEDDVCEKFLTRYLIHNRSSPNFSFCSLFSLLGEVIKVERPVPPSK